MIGCSSYPAPDCAHISRPGYMSRSLFVASVSAMALSSSMVRIAEAQTHPAAAAITAALATFAKALKDGDAKAAASIFALDATLVVPGKFVRGHDAIAAIWKKWLQNRRYQAVTLTTVSVAGSGNLAIEIGTNSLTFSDSGKAPVTVSGRYLTVWRKTSDGAWLIEADAPMADRV